MQTSVTFKNIDSSENLKSYVSDKLNRFDKYLDNPGEANVVLSVEKFRHIAEISLSGDRLVVNAKEETNDMYSAIDMALDKLEKQIKKNKEKIRERKGKLKNKSIDKNLVEEELAIEKDEQIFHIEVKNIDFKPMDVEEAVMQLGIGKNNFLVFTNARTELINVLYQRKNGNLGLIQPNN
jgi:putative sigma-54 modulation protein